MNRIYIYRLFRHSKMAFAFVVIFLFIYAVVFFKNMDMIFFPYNNMFADKTAEIRPAAYAVKANGKLIKITTQPYWKKDFLEASLASYCKYKKRGNALFLDDYLSSHTHNIYNSGFFLKRLTPEKKDADRWPLWFIHFAGYKTKPGVAVELIEYNFIYKSDDAFLNDSATIYKTTF